MNLRSLRLNAGMSVEDLAAAAGVPAGSVYYWERSGGGPRNPAAAKRVADVFSVSVTDIWPVEPPVAA